MNKYDWCNGLLQLLYGVLFASRISRPPYKNHSSSLSRPFVTRIEYNINIADPLLRKCHCERISKISSITSSICGYNKIISISG